MKCIVHNEEGKQCQSEAAFEVPGIGSVCHYHRGVGTDRGWSPSPWYYVSGAVWTTPAGSDDGGECIALRSGIAHIWPTVRDANLRLCSAAPDLFDALEYAESFISGFEGDEMQEGVDERLVQIRAALKKARPE
jgi:hypothetical protein